MTRGPAGKAGKHRPVATNKDRARLGVDDLDRRLLAHLQQNARASSAELARRLHLSAPGLQKRLRKLEARGVIKQHATIVRREAVGLDLLCFVHVMLAHHRPESVKRFPGRVERMPEVLECHFLTGEFDYLLKVVLANHDHLERFLFEKLMKVDGVPLTIAANQTVDVAAGKSLTLNPVLILVALAVGYYRYQRCGVEVPGVHPACHLDDARRRDNGQHVDQVGGWHDAGGRRRTSRYRICRSARFDVAADIGRSILVRPLAIGSWTCMLVAHGDCWQACRAPSCALQRRRG